MGVAHLSLSRNLSYEPVGPDLAQIWYRLASFSELDLFPMIILMIQFLSDNEQVCDLKLQL